MNELQLFKTKYGYFTADGHEYVITTPETPRPWSNLLTNGRYYSLCLHTGRGFSFYKNARHYGLTRWGCTLTESLMRYVYVKDGKDSWTLNWEPIRKPVSGWECRVGLGWTKITSERNGIRGSVTYTVPMNRDAEDWIITLKNTSSRQKKLQIFTGVEPQLGDPTVDLVTARFMSLFLRTKEKNRVLYITSLLARSDRPDTNERSSWPWEIYFAGYPRPHSFDLSHRSFMGDHRTASRPIAVERGRCANSINTGRQPVLAFNWQVVLEPGEEKRLAVSMGIQKPGRQHKPVTPERASADLERTVHYWRDYLTKRTSVRSPSPMVDLTVNTWNKYQCRLNFWWYSASVSCYRFGGGLWGFRDSSQAVLGNTATTPDLSRERLLEIGSHVFRDGRAVHLFSKQYHGYGTSRPSPHPDIVLWWVISVIEYIKETGKAGILQEIIPYQDGGRGTVYEHVEAILKRACENTGQKGLVLFEEGDWNDGMNLVGAKGKGVSVMATQVLVYVLNQWARLNRLTGNGEEAGRAEELAGAFKRNLNRYTWDGRYFVRAFDDQGRVIGSKQNREGKVYLNPQTWAVIADIAPREKLEACMEAVWKNLFTDSGVLLFNPPYRNPDTTIGIITRFLPGEKENAAVFQHAASWAIIAAAWLGHGDRAFQYYRASNPIQSGLLPDRFECEPYAYGEYKTGPASPCCGQGSHTWFTGAVPWMYRAATEYILGIRPEFEGLLVDPCIPRSWNGFYATRLFRGKRYRINVINQSGEGHGVKELLCDGKRVRAGLLKPSGKKRIHKVEVRV